ncbi:aspartate aminotransferase family protein [Sciscionella sediminilitoris]|uniref:aspartate aminotransferase family protein n=1 Tax=Sciscionella sediminilitoris TaxID=1445613 RepID=UPI0004DF2109|nr:aminotransferase class III-fold pyridoxal phosphate-dependent enzyme [Sciscionella sp. SE31]
MASLSPLLKQATPVVVDHGEGVYLYDTNGRRNLDFTSGIGVTGTGHCHPKVVAAAQEQVGKLIHGQYTTVMHQPMQKLTERLSEVLPSGLDSIFYANSGSEAVEAALRLARQATGRPNIITFQGGFHGRTVAAASLTTSGAKFRAGISPVMSGVHVAPFPYAYHYGWDAETTTDFALRELDYLFATQTPPGDTAAFLVEPILGEAGYIPTSERFLAGLRERADKYGMLLIFDEIQTGYGRTGKFWGHEHFAGKPDIITIAKGLASGFPLSAIAANSEVMGKAYPGTQGGTYGGNAVACAAALATLDVITEEGLVENAAARGKQLLDGVRKLAEQYPQIGDVRGHGLLLACEFVDAENKPDAATAVAVQQAAADNGLLTLNCCPFGNGVRMLPALVVTEEQIEEGLELFGQTLAKVLGS